MDLSLYLLLAPPTDGEQTPGTDQQSPGKVDRQVRRLASRERVPVFDPLRPVTARSKHPVQASRKTCLVPANKRATIRSIGFGLSVCANALGFLAITGGTLILLRMVEISLH